MKKKQRRSGTNSAAADARAIDERYGLEPVLDVSAPTGGAAASDFVTVHCPYCGEAFDTRIDTSGGSSSYVEDCQICCQPIDMQLSVDEGGQMTAFEARRLDQ
jgi:hypothetical protein